MSDADVYKDFIELEREELAVLKGFLEILFAEKQAICIFSILKIVTANNKKEELIKKCKFIKDEKERTFLLLDREVLSKNGDHVALADEIKEMIQKIESELKENLELLIFSFQQVKSSLETVGRIFSERKQ